MLGLRRSTLIRLMPRPPAWQTFVFSTRGDPGKCAPTVTRAGCRGYDRHTGVCLTQRKALLRGTNQAMRGAMTDLGRQRDAHSQWLGPERAGDNLSRYVSTLRHRGWLIVLTMILGVIAAGVYVKVANPVYKAQSTLLASPIPTGSSIPSNIPGLIYASSDPTRDVLTAATLVSSIEVARRVKLDLNLSGTPQSILGKVSIQPLSNTNVIAISAKSGSANAANVQACQRIRHHRPVGARNSLPSGGRPGDRRPGGAGRRIYVSGHRRDDLGGKRDRGVEGARGRTAPGREPLLGGGASAERSLLTARRAEPGCRACRRVHHRPARRRRAGRVRYPAAPRISSTGSSGSRSWPTFLATVVGAGFGSVARTGRALHARCRSRRWSRSECCARCSSHHVSPASRTRERCWSRVPQAARARPTTDGAQPGRVAGHFQARMSCSLGRGWGCSRPWLALENLHRHP